MRCFVFVIGFVGVFVVGGVLVVWFGYGDVLVIINVAMVIV